MRKFLCPLVLILTLLLLAGCGGGSGGENRVVVYSAGPRSLAEAVCEAFTASTGIETDLFQATTGQVLARLEAEKHQPRADVVLFASEVAAEAMKHENRLQAYSPARANELRQDWSDPEGFYHATGAALVGVATREDSPALPETWRELLTSPGEAALIMPSPSRSGSAGDFTVTFLLEHGEQGFEWFRAARGGGLDFASANSQAIGSLLMGAHDGILAAADYLIYRQIAAGEPLQVLYPEEGAVLVPRPLAITASAGNPEGAKRFVDFYFDDAAQALVAEAFLIPGRENVPPHEVRPDSLPVLLRADAGTAMEKQRELLQDFQRRVERADAGSAP